MPTTPPRRTARVLVVDDEAGLRRILFLMLTRSGHEVVVVSSGAEALRAAAEQVFDLVITDLVMPDMAGLDLIRAFRAMNPPLPIIAMSGLGTSTNGDLAAATALGAGATLEKPFLQQDVRVAIERVLGPDGGPGIQG